MFLYNNTLIFRKYIFTIYVYLTLYITLYMYIYYCMCVREGRGSGADRTGSKYGYVKC